MDTAPPAVLVNRRADGAILLDHPVPLPPVVGTIPARLRHWAARTPDAPFLTENDRTVIYAEAERICARLAGRLGRLIGDARRPILIAGDNGIDHALVLLAATSLGIPVAVVSPAYASAAAAPWGKLRRLVATVEPAIVLADDPAAMVTALDGASTLPRVEALRDLAWLDRVEPVAIADRETAVGPATVAKLLFTSGSTGSPKAVVNTQAMMVSNMMALEIVWPFLSERPPVMVDWLPWNHTFGGNCCFHIALWFGGHMVIDKGRPTPALVGRSVEAIRAHRPTIYFNVPVGYELLLPILEADDALAVDFLGRLDFIFNAGAALPSALRTRIEALALRTTGRPANIVGGWGSTETAPFATVLDFPTDQAANLGLPIPGTTIKMVPEGGRMELRVRGPNVTPGYLDAPELTATAFDEEGFYRIGDAGRLADPEDPSAGIVFDGRVAENFKLSTGTFVNVGAVRLGAINAGETLISDVVVVGEGRGELGLIVFGNELACRDLLGEEACHALTGAAQHHPSVTARLAELLRGHNASGRGSSMRLARFIIADAPPDPHRDEITDKGYINQRRVIANRAALVDRLFSEGTML